MMSSEIIFFFVFLPFIVLNCNNQSFNLFLKKFFVLWYYSKMHIKKFNKFN